ncbi:MAG: hypothetical protein ABSH15_04260 [Verrucomicrobiota bacterium]
MKTLFKLCLSLQLLAGCVSAHALSGWPSSDFVGTNWNKATNAAQQRALLGLDTASTNPTSAFDTNGAALYWANFASNKIVVVIVPPLITSLSNWVTANFVGTNPVGTALFNGQTNAVSLQNPSNSFAGNHTGNFYGPLFGDATNAAHANNADHASIADYASVAGLVVQSNTVVITPGCYGGSMGDNYNAGFYTGKIDHFQNVFVTNAPAFIWNNGYVTQVIYYGPFLGTLLASSNAGPVWVMLDSSQHPVGTNSSPTGTFVGVGLGGGNCSSYSASYLTVPALTDPTAFDTNGAAQQVATTIVVSFFASNTVPAQTAPWVTSFVTQYWFTNGTSGSAVSSTYYGFYNYDAPLSTNGALVYTNGSEYLVYNDPNWSYAYGGNGWDLGVNYPDTGYANYATRGGGTVDGTWFASSPPYGAQLSLIGAANVTTYTTNFITYNGRGATNLQSANLVGQIPQALLPALIYTGTTNIPAASNTLTIVIGGHVMPSTNYTPGVVVFGPALAVTNFVTFTSRTPSNFVANFTAPVGSANTNLGWSVLFAP